MVFTTYFAQLRNLPSNVIPISICARAPQWYSGIQYKKLAPKYDFFMEWKQNHDNDYYVEHFSSEVLELLDVRRVMNELQVALPDEVKVQMQAPFWSSKDWHVALVCYEKPSDFCHRHLVADWLRQNGYECSEWSKDKTLL